MRIILRIMGGLGNQLFQYAAMRLLNQKYPNSKMYIDSREYKEYKIRNYELLNFKLSKNISTYNDFNLLYETSYRLYHVYQYLYRKTKRKNAPIISKFFIKPGMLYTTIDYYIPDVNQSHDLFMYGYFVKVSMFESIKSILQEEIQLNLPLSRKAEQYREQIDKAGTSIGVSVRCDEAYAKLGWPICSPQFYKEAMKKIRKVKNDCRFFIFADRVDMVKSEGWFNDFETMYVEGCSIVESFTLLRSCHDFVISNSSFCWWAAWLADSDNKIVYAPNHFFGKTYADVDKNLLFKEERLLDYKTGEEVMQ